VADVIALATVIFLLLLVVAISPPPNEGMGGH
jgi:hypothetical protein